MNAKTHNQIVAAVVTAGIGLLAALWLLPVIGLSKDQIIGVFIALWMLQAIEAATYKTDLKDRDR